MNLCTKLAALWTRLSPLMPVITATAISSVFWIGAIWTAATPRYPSWLWASAGHSVWVIRSDLDNRIRRRELQAQVCDAFSAGWRTGYRDAGVTMSQAELQRGLDELRECYRFIQTEDLDP